MKQLLFLQYLIILQAFVILGIIEPLYLDKIGEMFDIQFIALIGMTLNISVFLAQITKKLSLNTIYIATAIIDSFGYSFVYFYNLNIELFIYAYIIQAMLLVIFITSYTAKFKALLVTYEKVDFEQFQYNERYLMSIGAILGAGITCILNDSHDVLNAYIMCIVIINVIQMLNYKNFKKFTKGKIHG